ncbi:hypothetical protein [Sphingomonas aerophila]|nr:hypothetical protein [Sphingomonas aerophila]
MGYVGESRSSDSKVAIMLAADAELDEMLVGTQVKVTLDAFQVWEYPGFSPHKVLFGFQGRDQAGEEAQDLSLRA